MSNSPDMTRILPVLDKVYDNLGGRPIRMALFWTNVIHYIDEKLIPKNSGVHFKPANIVNNSGKYQTFTSYPNNTMYVRRVGQEDSPIQDTSRHNFRNSLLHAFVVPLAQDKNRFYLLSPKYEYRDVDKGIIPQDGVAIERDLLLSDVSLDDLDQNTRKELFKRITEWADCHSVPSSAVYFEKNIKTPHNLYMRLIKSLSKEDLARISIPLDIVDKLMRTYL